MLDPHNDMIWSVEDMRGLEVNIGDIIARGVTVGQSAQTRVGKVVEFKRIPQQYGSPNYYVKVEWLIVENDPSMVGKTTLVNVNPEKRAGLVVINLP